MRNNLDEQQTTIYCVLKEKFEKFAEQQFAIALKIIQVRLAAVQTCVWNGVIFKLDVSIRIFFYVTFLLLSFNIVVLGS